MQIFIAGFYAGRAGLTQTNSIHLKISQLLHRYPHILESYHYIKSKPQMVKKIREHKNKIFLDSGAFTMFTQGVSVDLKKYAQFIKENTDIIHTAANLDAIGAGNEQLSNDRQKELEAVGVQALPVHHVGDHDDWLRKYLSEGYDYICLGGMVGVRTQTLTQWLDHVWGKYLVRPDGMPKVRVHGFGLTTLSLMFRYPWASVDSTSWVVCSRMGGIFLDFPQSDGTIKDFKIDFSPRAQKWKNAASWHFDSLTKPNRKMVLDRLEQLEAERLKFPEENELENIAGFKMGLNPEALAESYGWRDIACVEYFRRAMGRGVERFLRS